MASSINPLNINEAFPVAGQDNDSQGFRNNFTNIKNNLTHTKREIEDLQAKVILKETLTGGSPINNNFAGVLLSGAQTKGFTETVFDQGNKSGLFVIDYTAGDFQKATIIGPSNFVFTNWPTSGLYSTIRVWFSPAPSAALPIPEIIFPTSVEVGATALFGYNAADKKLVATRIGSYLIEFSTIDGGVTVTATVLASPVASTEYVMNTTDTNMHGHVMSNFTEKAAIHAFTSPSAEIDLSMSDFHKITTTQNLILSFINWSTYGYAKIRLWVTVTNSAHTIQFPDSVSVGLSKVPGVTGQTLTPTVGNYLFELSSMDSGVTVLIVPLITP